MGCFGNKRDRVLQLTLLQFKMELKRLVGSSHLLISTDMHTLEETCDDLFWSETGHGALPKVKVYESDWERSLKSWNRFLHEQADRAQKCKSHINNLFIEAERGTLTLNDNEVLPTNELLFPKRKIGADKRLEEVKIHVDMGARWIMECSGSYEDTNSNQIGSYVSITEKEISDVLFNCSIDIHNKKKSLFDLETLEFLHNKLVKGVKATRRPTHQSGDPFTTSGAGKFLLRYVAGKVRNLEQIKSSLTDNQWDCYSCFLLGAYLRAHGFSDGNGRPIRGLYVLALIQGLRPFKVPTAAGAKRLTGRYIKSPNLGAGFIAQQPLDPKLYAGI